MSEAAYARFHHAVARAHIALAEELAKTSGEANDDGPGSGEPRLIPAREAARLLGISVSYLYEHRDEYPFTKRIGRAVRFERRGLLAWMSRAAGA
jgi:excisionase family DNA binding protein